MTYIKKVNYSINVEIYIIDFFIIYYYGWLYA